MKFRSKIHGSFQGLLSLAMAWAVADVSFWRASLASLRHGCLFPISLEGVMPVMPAVTGFH